MGNYLPFSEWVSLAPNYTPLRNGFHPNFVLSWVCLLGKNPTRLFSIVMHFVDGSGNESSKYLQCFFSCPLIQNFVYRGLSFDEGPTFFILPLGGFRQVTYFFRMIAKLILLNTKNPVVS